MEKRKIELIKMYIGKKLLEYILNQEFENKFFDDNFFGKLSEPQKFVLTDLWQKICESRHEYIDKLGYGEISINELMLYNKDGANIYNIYRCMCGGNVGFDKSNDVLLNFIKEQCIEAYPNYLIAPSSNGKGRLGLFRHSLKAMDEFTEILKNNEFNKFSNGEEGIDYNLIFSLSDGSYYQLQSSGLLETIIYRAVQNSFNKMTYSIDNVLSEVEVNVTKLRNLIAGKTIKYPSYIGIKGLELEDVDCVDFGDFILRKWDDIENPSMHTSSTISTTSRDGNNYVIGSILEVMHSVKLIKNNPKNLGTYHSSIYEQQNNKLDALKNAIAFSKNLNHGFKTSFYESGFPLVRPGNFNFSNSDGSGHIIIEKKDVEDILKWYELLTKKEVKKLDISLRRLKSAIFDRVSSEDAIIDAIICWEGMFSEAFETTLKVTGSIARYLEDGENREILYKRLIKLYGLRSSLVHGGNNDILKDESIDDIKNEVIEIARRCLMKLMSDDDMLNKSPVERYKKLLVLY